MSDSLYVSDEYSRRNPGYHAEDSPFKAGQVLAMMERHHLAPASICEVGCGVGEILCQLQKRLPPETRLDGYEISPQAFEVCRGKMNSRLQFYCEDLLARNTELYDVLLCLDVVEHIEDCFGFLRKLKAKARWKIFHIPLDLTAQSVLRLKPILRGREQAGHIHYFVKDTALALLQETGHEVLDWFYTPIGLERAVAWPAKLALWPRRLTAWCSPDFAARVLGGYSLMVLTR